MAYIEDLESHETFPCSTVGITETTVTVNMNSRAGYLNLSQGGARNGMYQNNGNDIAVQLPGTIVGTQQQLEFTRQ